MTATAHPLSFPAGRPSHYLPLSDEPTFDGALTMPCQTRFEWLTLPVSLQVCPW